jgi:hypothetical protein
MKLKKSNILKKEARWKLRTVPHFDSISEKNQVTKSRLYSEERKRGRASEFTKRGGKTAKSMKKQKGKRERQNNPKLSPGFLEEMVVGEETEDTITR